MFRWLTKNRKGQTTVEYILIIAVITISVSLFGKGLKEKLPQTIDTVFRSLPLHVLAEASTND